MICTLTARRLKPGAFADFRAAWGPAGARPEGTERWTRISHCRDLSDEDVVLSLGLFDGTLEELRGAQDELGRGAQVAQIEPHAEETLLDGSYEIVEELSPTYS